MKKLISLIVLVCILSLCFASCDSTAANPENNPENNYENSTEETVQDCKTTGVHTYEKGICTGCEIKIYDIMRDFIMQNAETVNGSRYLYYSGSYTDDSNFTIFEYDSDSRCITILARMDHLLCTYSTDLYFTPYSLEDGEYAWDGECIKLGCKDCIDLSGTLDPSKFSKSTTRLSHTSSAADADYMAEQYAKSLKVNLDEEIIPFLENLGYNITIKDLGFARYQ